MTCRPAARPAWTLRLMKASLSPSLCRRSLWPRMTYRQPTSSSMAGLTSPVKRTFLLGIEVLRAQRDAAALRTASPTDAR